MLGIDLCPSVTLGEIQRVKYSGKNYGEILAKIGKN
jgi:hypothetical protein